MIMKNFTSQRERHVGFSILTYIIHIILLMAVIGVVVVAIAVVAGVVVDICCFAHARIELQSK